MHRITIIMILCLVSLANALPDPGCELTYGDVNDHRNFYTSEIGFLNQTILMPYDPDNPGAPVYKVGIAVHIVTDAAGNFGVDPADLQVDLNLLMTVFQQQVKIQFELLEQDTIANDDYVYTTYAEEENISALYNIANAVNIYYFPNPQGISTGRATFSPLVMAYVNEFISIPFYGQYIIINANRSSANTLTHEIGHFFDLFHTYDECLGDSAAFPNQYESGDLIPDTPVAQAQIIYQCNSAPNSKAWKLAHNFMSAYTAGNECRDRFTAIQRQQMRYVLVNRRAEYNREWVRLSNTIGGQNAGGQLRAVQSPTVQTINSGDYVRLKMDQNVEISTLTERFINGAEDISKHHDWNQIFSQYLLTEVLPVESNMPDQDARFLSIAPATIKNNLLSTDGADGGVLDFHDPWYADANNNQPDDFITWPSPHYPKGKAGETEGGVFLNQPYDDPPNPYYSVQAPTQQVTVNGKSITWDWESWSYNPAEIDLQSPEGNPTAVMFKSANAALTANLKGRRTSDTPQATANNNGFHLAAGITYPYLVPQLAYSDRGNIYHSKATQIVGGGVSWGKDKLIAQSQAEKIYSAPALSPLQTYPDIEPFNTPITVRTVLAYDQYNPVTSKYNVAGGVLTGPPSNFFVPFSSSPFTPASYPRHPSAAGYYHIYSGDQRIAVALRGFLSPLNPPPAGGIAVWFTKNNSTYTITSNSSADFPALDCRKRIDSNQNPHYYLAWQQDDGIHYREFEDQNSSLVFSGSETVLSAGYSYLSDHRLPAIQGELFERYPFNYKDTVTVVWQAMDYQAPDEDGPVRFLGGEGACPVSPKTPVICFREKKWNTWGPLYIFFTSNYCDRRPVVCSWPVGASRDCLIAYEHFEGKIYYVKRSGGNWQTPVSVTADGAHPAVTTLAGAPQLLYSEFQQPPYRLEHIEQVLPEERSGEFPPHSRRVSFRLRESLLGGRQLPIDGDITFEMADPQWLTQSGSQPVKPLYRDSLITPENAFRFNPITISQGGERLIIPVKIVGRDLKRVSPQGNNPFPLPLLRLRLKDENNGQVLQTVHTFQSTILGNDSTRYIEIADTFEIELSALVSRRIRVEGATFFNPIEPGRGRPQIAEVYDLREEISQSRLAGKVPAVANAEIPKQFSLSQNYPNPFNPTTTIEFQLPQNSFASLRVYDIRGRLVRMLLNQEMEAGSRRVT